MKRDLFKLYSEPTSEEVKNLMESGKKKTSTKDFDGAVDDFTKAIKLDPKYSLSYYSRGLAHYSNALNNPHSSANSRMLALKDFTKAKDLGNFLAAECIENYY